MKKAKKKFSGNLNPFLVLMVMVVICTIVSYFVVPGAYDRETVDGAACEALLNNTWAEFSKKEAAGEIPPDEGFTLVEPVGKQEEPQLTSPRQAAEPQGDSSQQ